MIDESEFVGHEPCPECGSSNNLARYSDGHAYCFTQGCEYYEPGDGEQPTQGKQKRMNAELLRGEVKPLGKRGISVETCHKFGYHVAEMNGQTVQVANYFDPDGRSVVAQKVRFKDKSFRVLGGMKEAGLFGQHLWRDKGKMVVVTEGEIDALSVSQLQGNKWPVVSLKNGASSAKKSLAHSLDWLCGFAKVVLFFDNDEPGREAAEAAAGVFPPGKAFIARMTDYKDPNEALQAGAGKDVIDAIWGAKEYRPDGLVTLDDIIEEVQRPVEWGLPWFIPSLTEATYGRRMGECVALGAGTGVGKTDLITQQVVHDLTELKQPVGIFFLEQNVAETGKRLAGKWAGKTFHIPDSGWTTDELLSAVNDLKAGGRLTMYDSFGRNDWEVIEGHIRYLAQSEGIRLFYLDHLTALAQGSASEVAAEIEVVMESLASLCKELGVWVLFVSHLATPDGKPHEEGGRVMIRHFKGSRAIGFWSHFMFGLERDQQADDEEERQTTIFRILKDRYTGRSTGRVISLGYNQESGTLYEKLFQPAEDGDQGDDASLPF